MANLSTLVGGGLTVFGQIPLNSQGGSYTLVLADAGSTILHPASDDNPRTFTIPSNSSVAFPVGTIVTFINLVNTLTIACNTDNLFLAGGSIVSSSRDLGQNGIATAVKVASTTWLLSGNGIS